VRIPAAYELEHILLCGAPGSGKTNIILKMLDGIRVAGKRAIVYDTAGTFMEKFYRPGKDTLLNPLDQRSAPWSPWVDVPRDYHYDQIAEIDHPRIAWRSVLGQGFARHTGGGDAQAGTPEAHFRLGAAASVAALAAEGSGGFRGWHRCGGLHLARGERTSAGIQAELASVMRSFSYLDDTEDGFPSATGWRRATRAVGCSSRSRPTNCRPYAR
jgi:energy-coupling factor transporter ATP-binding protein EcfA2